MKFLPLEPWTTMLPTHTPLISRSTFKSKLPSLSGSSTIVHVPVSDSPESSERPPSMLSSGRTMSEIVESQKLVIWPAPRPGMMLPRLLPRPGQSISCCIAPTNVVALPPVMVFSTTLVRTYRMSSP